jgi:hypothetical protein
MTRAVVPYFAAACTSALIAQLSVPRVGMR